MVIIHIFHSNPSFLCVPALLYGILLVGVKYGHAELFYTRGRLCAVSVCLVSFCRLTYFCRNKVCRNFHVFFFSSLPVGIVATPAQMPPACTMCMYALKS